MKSVTSGLEPSRSTPELIGAGLPRQVPEASTPAVRPRGAGFSGADGPEPVRASTLGDVPASSITARRGRVTDPRLTTPAAQDGSKHEQTITNALAALEQLTAVVRDFHTTSHRQPYDGKSFPIGERPAKLPKVVTAATEGLRSVRDAAALFDAGRADRASFPGLRTAFEGFLDVHAALILGEQERHGYEQEPAYKDARALLSMKLEQLWSLAPAFLGKELVARLERQRLPAVPKDLPPVREAAAALSDVIRGSRAPEALAPRDTQLQTAVQILKDNLQDADYYREGGKHAIGLHGFGMARMVNGRWRAQASLEDVELASRTVLERLGLDATLPIAVRHPGPTPLRREEAWSVLRQAFDARDFIDVPTSGSEYGLRRWQPEALELLPPPAAIFLEDGSGSEAQILRVAMYPNKLFDPLKERSHEEGTPKRLESDLKNYLWRRGFRDIHVFVTPMPRPLSPEKAEALRQRLAAVLSSDSKPAYGTPEAIVKAQVNAVEVEIDALTNAREVVVYTPGTTTWDSLRLLEIEGAVRALLSDDPTATATRIRVKLDPRPNGLGHLPEPASVLFGRFSSEADRRRAHEDAQAVDARLAADPGLRAYDRKVRAEALERFASGGAVQAELVAEMKSDLDGTQAAWKHALGKNLTAWFLGEGSADPAWRQSFEQLPLAQRADLLEISLEFLGDTDQTPALREALVTFRRLEGRAALEAACTRNGTQSPEQMAQTDAIFGDGLRGPAREAALAVITEARQA